MSEVFGEVWSAPLTTIRADDVRGTVEKEISEKEYALKKAKCTKRNATPGDSTAPAASNPDVIEIDDDAWSIPSEDDCPKAAKGGAKAVKNTSERDAATAARKALREKELSWKKEVGKASKCIQMLHSVCASMTLLLGKCDKQPLVVGDELKQSLKDASDKLQKFKIRVLSAFPLFQRCVR